MAEKKQNDVSDETTAEEAAEAPEEAVVETPAAEAEETVTDAEAPAEEPVAEAAETAEEPVTPEEPVAESAAEKAPAEPEAAEPAEEPVAAAEPETTPAETEAPAEATPAPQSGPKVKKKRLPRALRPQKTRPTRQKAAERKPMVRLEVPEHERGRRQERQGTVVSDAMEKTIVVRVDTVKAHPRYKKVVRQSAKFHAHDEQGQAKVGDVVRIVETRPLSKTKRWRLAEVVEAAK